MRHLLSPLHGRRGNADEISVEERIRQSVAGVLLTCRDYKRRSRNMRVQEVTQTVAESALTKLAPFALIDIIEI